MADNTTLNTGSGGDVIATDDIAGVKHQRVKVQHGADGSATDVSAASPLPVDGSGVTQPVSAASLPLPTGASTEATLAAIKTAVELLDNMISGSEGQVDVVTSALPTGAATAANQATANTALAAIQTAVQLLDNAIAGSEMQVDVLTSALPTGAATEATLASMLTALQLIDDAIFADDAAFTLASSKTMVAGAIRDDALSALTAVEGDAVPLRVSSTGALHVTGGGGGTEVAEDAASSGGELGSLALGYRQDADTSPVSLDGDYHGLIFDNAGALKVHTKTSALPSGAATEATLAAIQTAVELIDNMIAGSEAQVDVVTLPASTNTIEVVGDVAADAAAAGNPLGIGAVAETMADSAPSSRVSADADAVRIAADRDGAVYVHPHGPQTWSYHENSSSALTDATVHAAPGAGLSLYVTDIILSTGAATALNVFFEESTTTVLGPYYLEAVAGRGLHIRFVTPKKITANTALTVTTSAAIAHGIDVLGFIAP